MRQIDEVNGGTAHLNELIVKVDDDIRELEKHIGKLQTEFRPIYEEIECMQNERNEIMNRVEESSQRYEAKVLAL